MPPVRQVGTKAETWWAQTRCGGFPETIPYGVTHAEWSARHVGTLQDMDFDALTGVQWDTYGLKSTNAKPWGGTNGALMLLLMQ